MCFLYITKLEKIVKIDEIIFYSAPLKQNV